MDIAQQRLHNQQLAQRTFQRPGDVVQWLGAMQAQDYLGALWAVGLRMPHATEAMVEQALADRSMIRTWPMRGTLHFVAAADARWMLELLTPRVVAGSVWRLKQLGIDEGVLARSKELIVKALSGGKQLTRDALYAMLAEAGISTAGSRGLHILGQLAQNRIICFGAREGKQQTFALFDEWVPPSKPLDRDAALAELARRYFTSHGPALLEDFVWWSGLTLTDARAGLEMAKSHLLQESIDGKSYWYAATAPIAKDAAPAAFLLPAYDEYTVAYRDRSAVLNPIHAKQAKNGIFSPVVVVNGQVVGTWRRSFKKQTVVITTSLFRQLNETEHHALALAAQHYGAFLGIPGVLS